MTPRDAYGYQLHAARRLPPGPPLHIPTTKPAPVRLVRYVVRLLTGR
jgi:hypothetical protein